MQTRSPSGSCCSTFSCTRSTSPAAASASAPPAPGRAARRWWSPTTGPASRPRTASASSSASSPPGPAETVWDYRPAGTSPGRTAARSRCGTAEAELRSCSPCNRRSKCFLRAILSIILSRAMKRAAALALALAGACNMDPSAPHLARGNVLVNTGHRDEAVAEYREAARLAPRSALARERLGDSQYDLGRKAEALSSYREAAAIDPGSVTARVFAARGEGVLAGEALGEASRLVEPDARIRLAEQGLRGAALDNGVREATDRSLAQMQSDPAFLRWAQDPAFRRAAWRQASR